MSSLRLPGNPEGPGLSAQSLADSWSEVPEGREPQPERMGMWQHSDGGLVPEGGGPGCSRAASPVTLADFVFFSFEVGSSHVTQASLQLELLLPGPPKC